MRGRFITLLAGVVMVTLGGGVLALWHVNHSVVAEARSPEGSLQAIAMMLNDVGKAPYGNAVVVVRWRWEKYFKEPVFLGYCNRGIDVRWTSDRDLTISCPGGRIERTTDGESAAVRVQVELGGGVQ